MGGAKGLGVYFYLSPTNNNLLVHVSRLPVGHYLCLEMASLWWNNEWCSLHTWFSKIVCVAVLSSVMLSDGSYSESHHTSDHVMRNKLGTFDFEELENHLYRVEISKRPIAAAATVQENQDAQESFENTRVGGLEKNEDSENEGSTSMDENMMDHEDRTDYNGGIGSQVRTPLNSINFFHPSSLPPISPSLPSLPPSFSSSFLLYTVVVQ